jgi:hypothetical protein
LHSQAAVCCTNVPSLLACHKSDCIFHTHPTHIVHCACSVVEEFVSLFIGTSYPAQTSEIQTETPVLMAKEKKRPFDFVLEKLSVQVAGYYHKNDYAVPLEV